MLQGVSETVKQWRAALASYLYPATPPELYRCLVVGAQFGGKSTTVDQIIECLNDSGFSSSRKLLTIRPTPAAEERDPARFPTRTKEPIPYPMWLTTGCGAVKLEIDDYPGQHLNFLQTGDDTKDSEDAKAFRAAVASADALIITLSPGDLFEKTEQQRINLLNRLVDLVYTAAEHARTDNRPFRVFVLYTKCEQYGEPGIGEPRTDRAFRRALGNLRAELPNATEGLTASLAHGVGTTEQGQALRRQLIERSVQLWTGLARCGDLDPAAVHAYFAQATATWPGARPVPWTRRGIPQLIEDLAADVRDRHARPVSYWALAGAAAVAAVVVAGAAHSSAVAADANAFTSEYRTDLVHRIPANLGRAELVKRPALFETARPRPREDQPGRLAFLQALNDAPAAFAGQLPALGGSPEHRFAQLRSARANCLEWNGIWDRLTPREQKAGESLRNHVRAVQDLNASFLPAETAIDAALRAASAPARTTAEKFARAANYHRLRHQAHAEIANLRGSELGARSFIRAGGGEVAARSVGDDLFAPWCSAAEQIVRDATQTVVHDLSAGAAGDPRAYQLWLLSQPDGAVAFLTDLAPALPRNPFTMTVPGPDRGRQIKWEWPTAPIYGYVRIRVVRDPLPMGKADEFDIDFETRTVHAVRDGVRAEAPYTGSSERDALQVRWSGEPTLQLELCEVVGVWVKANKNGGYERVPLACRGEATFALATFLARATKNDPALTGVPAPADPLYQSWVKLMKALNVAHEK